MDRKEIFNKLNEIFMDALDIEKVSLKDETTALDIEGWDSLSHVQLVYNIEEFFGIEFKSREILKWNNVGEMVDSIERGLNN